MTQHLSGRGRPRNLPKEGVLSRPVRPATTTKGNTVNYQSKAAQDAQFALEHYQRWLSSLTELLRLDRLQRAEYVREYAFCMYGMATENRLLGRHGEADKCTELARGATASILEEKTDE